MEFYIGAEFSREFSFEETRITHKLAEDLNKFFNDKRYGDRISKLNINVICVSKDFEVVCIIRPLRILRKEPMLVYEFKLDFETFKSSNAEKRKSLLINEFFKKTKEYLIVKKINGFDYENFVNDLESYFKVQGYSVGNVP